MAYPTSFQQQQRIQRMQREPLFLLDYKPADLDSHEGEDIVTKLAEWKISGSTRNVYTVTLYLDHSLWCDCPDMKSGASKYKCVCKHVCFVLMKVGKFQQLQHFFQVLHLSATQVNELMQKMTQGIWQTDRDVVNTELASKFKALFNEPEEETKEDKKEANEKPIAEDDDCPICYDPLLEHKKPLQSCPTCRNYFHVECLSHWLSIRNTCAYCRSPMNLQTHGSSSSHSQGSYINLS